MTDNKADTMNNQKAGDEAVGLEDAIKAKAVEGRISCAVLRKIAEDSGLHYRKAGEAANSLGIKIKSCDLGCF